MRSSFGSLVTLQRMQLMLPAMRPLTREGSLPSWSESNSCAQWPSKKTLSIFVVFGPPHLEAGHRSPQDMFDASCHCSWNICGVSGRLFLDACYGAQRANFWHLKKKGARHQFAKQCEASPPTKFWGWTFLRTIGSAKPPEAASKNNGVKEKLGRLVNWAPELFDPWRKQVLTQLTCSQSAGWVFPQPRMLLSPCLIVHNVTHLKVPVLAAS